MEETICNLSSSIGGCIRVRSTGLPIAYDDILYTIGGVFFTSACLAWAPSTGLYNPFVVLTVYIVCKMIIGVGNDMEDPFGHDESDLPLAKFCDTIEKQINAVSQRARETPYNLAYGPSSDGNDYLSYNTFNEDEALCREEKKIEIGMRETDPLNPAA